MVSVLLGRNLDMTTDRMTPRDLGALRAESAPALTDQQIEKAARILATVTRLPGESGRNERRPRPVIPHRPGPREHLHRRHHP